MHYDDFGFGEDCDAAAHGAEMKLRMRRTYREYCSAKFLLRQEPDDDEDDEEDNGSEKDDDDGGGDKDEGYSE